jgi:hypothetical protein
MSGFDLQIFIAEDDDMMATSQAPEEAGQAGYKSPSCSVVPVLKPMFPSPAYRSRMQLDPLTLPPSVVPSTPESKSEVKYAKISPYAQEEETNDQVYFNFPVN